MENETDAIGAEMDKLYGEPHPQDKHIDYFYFRLGKQIINKQSEVLQILNRMPDAGQWGELESKWPGYLIGKFPKGSIDETERDREERLNIAARLLVAKELGILTSASDLNNPTPIPIMLSRVCKYTNRETTSSMNMHDIGKVLAKTNSTSSDHQDFFYLAVEAQDIQGVVITDKDVFMDLRSLPGDWQIAKPWEYTFFGYFPKTPFDKSEREREERLNREVRVPLMVKLEVRAQCKESDGEPNNKPKPKVIVIITRACKYMHMH